MQITRRKLCYGAAAVALAAAAAGLYKFLPSNDLPDFPTQALAAGEKVPLVKLMQPGDLPDMVLGSEKAPVTIVEYASMTCPHCAHFAETTYPELKKRYIDTGKVRYIFREFPLDALALDAAVLARCAAKDDKDRYFTMIDALFRSQRDWVLADSSRKPHPALRNKALLAFAKQAGFTEESYKACVTNQQIVDAIGKGLERAVNDFKVQSTPTFFINGASYAGALSIDEMAKLIDPQVKG